MDIRNIVKRDLFKYVLHVLGNSVIQPGNLVSFCSDLWQMSRRVFGTTGKKFPDIRKTGVKNNPMCLRFPGRTLMVILFLLGCQSMSYYRQQTVKKAREYALEKLKKFSEIQRDYIRYTPPVLMQNLLFQVEGKKVKSKRDILQTCVVWTDVPGIKENVVVAGVSTRRLNDWEPVRVVLKTFPSPDLIKAKAVTKARKYLLQHFPEWSANEQNRIRFVPPEIKKTSFKIDMNKKWIKSLDEPLQTSFIWKSDEKNKILIVIGVGEPNLKGWKPITGGKRSVP